MATRGGNWSCFIDGASDPSGVLTMTSSKYTYRALAAATPLSNGSGSYTIDKNVVHISSGPLRNGGNVHLGYFNTRVSPPVLVLNTGVARGLTCRTDSDL
jgi:hypothetical protein